MNTVFVDLSLNRQVSVTAHFTTRTSLHHVKLTEIINTFDLGKTRDMKLFGFMDGLFRSAFLGPLEVFTFFFAVLSGVVLWLDSAGTDHCRIFMLYFLLREIKIITIYCAWVRTKCRFYFFVSLAFFGPPFFSSEELETCTPRCGRNYNTWKVYKWSPTEYLGTSWDLLPVNHWYKLWAIIIKVNFLHMEGFNGSHRTFGFRDGPKKLFGQ